MHGHRFGACLDTRRSVSGVVVIQAKGEISRFSRTLAVTASGSSGAEYVALSEAVKEVIFLRPVQDFMELLMSIDAVNMFEDNEEAMKLAVNKYASRSLKHIDAKHHLGRDACDARKVRMAHVRTEDQHPDWFTKPLDIQKFQKHVKTVLNDV